MAVGQNGTILRTTNGGTSWAIQTSGTTKWLWSVFFTDVNTGTAVGRDGTILRTTNGGALWTSQTSGTPNILIYSVFFTDANTGTAVGESGKILRTTNGGALWTSQTSGTIMFLYDVFFTDANMGTAVGGSFGGGLGTILHTTNGGGLWTNQSTGKGDILLGVFFTNANTGTVVGTSGTIIRTTTGGVVSVQEDPRAAGKLPENFALEQNYPNPFNPSTTIEFSIPTANNLTLKVYNALGQEVATIANGQYQAGTYSVQWDASVLASGVYFYRLQAGNFSETKKLVLMK